MKLQELLIEAYEAKEEYEYISSTKGFDSKEAHEAYLDWMDKEHAYWKVCKEISKEQNEKVLQTLNNNNQ